jgi:hypothetical protein
VHALVGGVHAAIIIIGTSALIQINNVNKRATPFTVRERKTALLEIEKLQHTCSSYPEKLTAIKCNVVLMKVLL